MANKGLSMRKVREVLRLHYAAGLSTRAIARSLKVSPATVGKYIRRAEGRSPSGCGTRRPDSTGRASSARTLSTTRALGMTVSQ